MQLKLICFADVDNNIIDPQCFLLHFECWVVVTLSMVTFITSAIVLPSRRCWSFAVFLYNISLKIWLTFEPQDCDMS